MENFSFETNANKEIPKWKRIPITVEVEGVRKNVWVNYIVEMNSTEGVCIECKKENQSMPCESAKEVRVESDDADVIVQATEKIKELVKRHEQKMFACKDCLNDDFMEKRTNLYIEALEESQDELGIDVDKEEQRKRILGMK